MIQIQKLTKDYCGKKVVDNLSLSVKKGTIFGFLGPNGAGKTTTIKMIVGISQPTSGKVKLENKKIDKSIIGYMPEDPYFYDQLSAKEFLTFISNLFPSPQLSSRASNSESRDFPYRRRRPEQASASRRISPPPLGSRNDKILEILEMVGLENVDNQRIVEFSKGMKQRLGLAQAMINDPEYLLLDEPLDGLDPIGRLEFKKILLDLKKRGKTIFFNSHILSDVEEICDEIGILDKGKLVYSGSVRKFRGTKSLEQKFVEVISKK
jgi:ABC-2 type transport system ATP-binding protein